MNPWRILGLQPGADRDAIRRAYARLLKGVNPEDDPDGFMRLREAHDAALAQLKWRQQWPEELEADEGSEAPAPDLAVAEPLTGPVSDQAVPAAPPPPEPPPRDVEADDLLARQLALVSAIDSGDATAQRDALAGLMAAPALAGIVARDHVERWLAALAADRLPASDPLVIPLIELFGWSALAIGQPGPDIARLLRRREEGELVARIAQPHADLHVGYQALANPPSRLWRLAAPFNGQLRNETRRILALAEGPLPGILDWLNDASVEWWRTYHAVPRLTLWRFIGIFLVAAVVLVGTADAAGLPDGLQKALAVLAWAAPWGFVQLLRQRQRWQSDWDRPEWQFIWWPVPFLALPLVAALWPPVALLVPIFTLGALAAVAWLILALDRLEPASVRDLVPGLVRALPAWLFLFLLSLGGPAADGALAVRGFTVAALALAWWQAGDLLVAMARHRLGERADALLAGLALAVAGVAAALPLLPFDGVLLAGRGLALLPLGLLAGLTAFRLAQGVRQLLPSAALLALLLALLWLADRVEPAAAGDSMAAGATDLLAGAARVLTVAGIGIVVNLWRERARLRAAGRGWLLWAAIAALLSGLVWMGASAPSSRPPPAERRMATLPQPMAPVTDWLQLDAELRAAAPGDYRFRVVMGVDAQGRPTSCTPLTRTGLAAVDKALCPQLMQAARFSPGHDKDGQPKPSLAMLAGGWQVRPLARTLGPAPAALPTAAAPPPRREPVITCPAPDGGTGPMVAEPCMRDAWIGDGDYPRGPLARHESGTVGYLLVVGKDGRVAKCVVERSSGHKGLDDDSCALITRRARFVPARDVDGSPMEFDYRSAIRWELTNG